MNGRHRTIVVGIMGIAVLGFAGYGSLAHASTHQVSKSYVAPSVIVLPEETPFHPSAWDLAYKQECLRSGSPDVPLVETTPARKLSPHKSDVFNYTDQSTGAIKIHYSDMPISASSKPEWSNEYAVTSKRLILPARAPNGAYVPFLTNSHDTTLSFIFPGTYEVQLMKDGKLILQPKIINVYPHKVSFVKW